MIVMISTIQSTRNPTMSTSSRTREHRASPMQRHHIALHIWLQIEPEASYQLWVRIDCNWSIIVHYSSTFTKLITMQIYSSSPRYYGNTIAQRTTEIAGHQSTTQRFKTKRKFHHVQWTRRNTQEREPEGGVALLWRYGHIETRKSGEAPFRHIRHIHHKCGKAVAVLLKDAEDENKRVLWWSSNRWC